MAETGLKIRGFADDCPGEMVILDQPLRSVAVLLFAHHQGQRHGQSGTALLVETDKGFHHGGTPALHVG